MTLNLKSKKQKYKKGQTFLAFTIFFIFISLSVVSALGMPGAMEFNNSRGLLFSKKSYYLAESGVEDAVFRVKTGKQISASETITLDDYEAVVSISDAASEKKIISTGNAGGWIRKIQTKLTTDIGAEFHYGAQTGEGGLEMSESSRIEGAGGTPGNIYSNGNIEGGNNAVITGDVIVAPTLTEDKQASSTVCNQDQIVGQANPQIDFAQSFHPSFSKPLSKISLYVKKVGNPADTNVKITADAGGSPANTALAQGILISSLAGNAYGWIDIVFSSPANLINGTTYWIILDAKKDANKYWVWCKDNNEGYVNGAAKFSQDWDDDPWTLISGDLNFKTFLGSGVSSIDNMIILGNGKADSITNSKICGDGYYKTIDASSLNFINNPSAPTCLFPLSPGTAYGEQPSPSIQNMPFSEGNIQDFKTAAEGGGVITGNCGDGGAAECVISDNGTISLGPKKIIGNLILTKKQTMIVTSGPLYFTGNIDIDSAGGATVKCDSSFGTKSCVIVADGWVHLKNNTVFQGSGQSGSYIMILTTLIGCNGNGQLPQCSHHNAAIDIHNNATGAVFYANASMINLHNGVNVTELTGYKLRLDNNAVIVYEQGLANAQFASGPSGSWKIKNWQETE